MSKNIRSVPQADVSAPPTTAPRIIYLGGYVDEAIVRERGLRSHNAAGSNRMVRIGRALAAAGYRPVLLSPATSLRAWVWGAFLHPVRLRRAGQTPVVFSAMVNVPALNVLIAPLLQFVALRSLLRRGNVTGAVIYNFNPSLVVLTAYMKYVWQLRVVQDVEDISEPRLRDWLPSSSTNPVQQIVFWICQHIISRMVDGYFVPTRRFLKHLPQGSKRAVVTGCIAVDRSIPQASASPLRVLFAGKVEREHGIETFVRALKILDARETGARIQVDITGTGDLAHWVERELRSLRRVNAQFHGFVSSPAYRGILKAAHVCVALQDASGRHAQYKTPSKVYEFLGYAKAVIATDVGDIAALGREVLVILPVLRPEVLAAALERMAENPRETATMRQLARAHAEKNFSYRAVGAVLHALLDPKDSFKA